MSGSSDSHYYSCITDGVDTIRSIKITKYDSTGYLYSVQAKDSNNFQGTQVPNGSNRDQYLQEVVVPASQNLTGFKIWTTFQSCWCESNCWQWNWNSNSYQNWYPCWSWHCDQHRWYQLVTQIEFLFSDLSTETVTGSKHQTSDNQQLITFSIPANHQIVGFYANAFSTCDEFNYAWSVYYRPNSCSDIPYQLDLSSINGKDKTIVTDKTASQKTFVLNNPKMCGMTCDITYKLTVTSGPNPNLITLPDNTKPELSFASSQSLADAGEYKIEVQWSADGGNTWSAAKTATFTYINPCMYAIFDAVISFPSLTLYVGNTQSTTLPSLWQDNVTQSNSNGTLICAQTVTQYVANANPLSGNVTLAAKITYTPAFTTMSGQSYTAASSVSISTAQSIQVAPTDNSEIGKFDLNVVACINDNANSCKIIQNGLKVNIKCPISFVDILQSSPSSALTAQSWTISTSIPFTYMLAVDTTKTCGFSPSAWTLSASSTNNPTQTSNFQTISSSGLFKAGQFQDYLTAGVYKVQVVSVDLIIVGDTYSVSQITDTPAIPSWFQLTVIDPCATATVTPSTVLLSSILVQRNLDPIQTIPFTPFTYIDSNSKTSLCGDLTYTVTSCVPTGDNQMISTFKVDTTVANSFSAQSLDLNQVGTFKVTLTGKLQKYPTVTASTYFTITVNNPCWLTAVTPDITQIQNILMFSGYSRASSVTYTFNDTMSQLLARAGDTQDYCGDKDFSFTIDGAAATTQLSGKNTQTISFTPTLTKTQFFTQQAILQVTMKDYQNISQSYKFNVTSLGSDVTVIPDQTYMVGSAMKNITFDAFLLLPADQSSDPQLENTYTVYIVSEGTDLLQADLNCSCLQKIKNQTWIKYSTEFGNAISVYTNDNVYAASYQIAVVQTFTYFPLVKYFSQFTLIVNPLIIPSAPIINLTPNQKLVKVKYLIGAKTPLLNLLQYYKLPPTLTFQLEIYATQITGATTVKFSIDPQFQFYIFENDESFDATTAQYRIYVSTNLPNQIPNQDLIIQVVFAVDSDNKSAQVMENGVATFEQKDKFISQRVKLKPLTNSTDIANQKYGAQIYSVSQLGLVTIKFYQLVHVPQFNQSVTTTKQLSQTGAALDDSSLSLTLQQFMDTQVLDVKLLRYSRAEKIDWQCTNFTKSTMQIQLEFSKPLDISSGDKFDMISIQFLQPKLFILESMQGFLFQEDSDKTLKAQIPPQFPSEKTLAMFTQMATSANNSAPGIIIVTLILQIIAKKVISSIFIFYSILQIILLISLHANVQLPASVTFIANTIDGIINLSSLDMQTILSTIKLPAIEKDSLLAKLSGLSLAILLVIAIALVILILRKLNLSEKAKKFVGSIVKLIFWNFLIRYLQVSFINMNYASLTSVLSTNNLFEKIMSANILVVLYSLACLVSYILLTRPNEYLSLQATKQSIGNLYLNLQTEKLEKRFFGAMFFVQRTLIVIVMAFKIDFGMQYVLIQTTLMVNAIYLFAVKPYTDWVDARVDNFNTLILLFTEVVLILASPYVTDTQQRFQYGIYYDCLLGIAFVANICYIAFLSVKPMILKFKQYRYRKNLKQKRLADQLKKSQEKLEIQEKLRKAALEAEEQLKREHSASLTNTKGKSNSLFLFQHRNPMERGPQKSLNQEHDPYHIPIPAVKSLVTDDKPSLQKSKNPMNKSMNLNAPIQSEIKTQKRALKEPTVQTIPQQKGFNKSRPKKQEPKLQEQTEYQHEIDAVSNLKCFSPNSSQYSGSQYSLISISVQLSQDFSFQIRQENQGTKQIDQQGRIPMLKLQNQVQFQKPKQTNNYERNSNAKIDSKYSKQPEIKQAYQRPQFNSALEQYNQHIFLREQERQAQNQTQIQEQLSVQNAQLILQRQAAYNQYVYERELAIIRGQIRRYPNGVQK